MGGRPFAALPARRILAAMPPPRPSPLSRARSGARAVVLGDLALDVVLAPARPLELGTDVPGVVRLHQGGSAANTARWLARLGVRTTLVCAVGRDAPGRALVRALHRDGVTVRATRPAGARTARIGMLVDATGERSFVTERGVADLLSPRDVRATWFERTGVLHLPAYSLLGSPLGEAAARAVVLAREAGARVAVDLASSAPLLAGGLPSAQRLVAGIAPDVLFTNSAEAAAFLGDADLEGLLAFAPVAIVKRGADGATVLARDPARATARFEVATSPVATSDTTGSGDAFDAGFLAEWLARGRATTPAALRRACVAGHRVAARRLAAGRPELALR
jgi:sugar/nucleoside kinase (ribokinase family)